VFGIKVSKGVVSLGKLLFLIGRSREVDPNKLVKGLVVGLVRLSGSMVWITPNFGINDLDL
jgi:hypothetical protein